MPSVLLVALPLSGKIDAKAGAQTCSNSTRIAPRIDIFAAMTTTAGLTLVTMEKKRPDLILRSGPFNFKSGGVLLFHTATV